MAYQAHIPETISEVMDLLGSIMLSPPTMADSEFPGRNLDTEFSALNEGLKRVRKRLGEERYEKAVDLSNRMYAHFAADPGDTNGEAHKGYLLIHEMDALLKQRRPKA